VNYEQRDEVNLTGMKFKVYMVVTTEIAVFWDIIQYNMVVTYQY